MATLTSMLVTRAKATLYAAGLAVADGLGLTTTSWSAGDPTRSLYHFVAEGLETLEVMVAGFVSSGFLDHAAGDWLTILAKQFYNVDRVEATYAAVTVTLTNAGGGVFTIAAGDVRVKQSVDGQTYTNTTGGTLAALGTLDLDFIADEAGSDGGSAFAGDIDTMVTAMLGVTCSNALAALGLDAEEDAPLRDRCRAKLGMLSPNGPADAYNYVVRSSDLTGDTTITRSRTVADDTTGEVTVYVAGAAGAVLSGAVTLAQSAVETWATPLTVTPTVVAATEVIIPVTYSVWIYSSVGATNGEITSAIEAALLAMFAARPIGGDIISPATTGKMYQSLIASTIKEAYPAHVFRVTVSAPAGDASLAVNEVATLGTVTYTVSQEVAP